MKTRSVSTATLALLLTGHATPASAAVPFFNATCPNDVSVHADEGGPVYVNGRESTVERINDSYYEARDERSGITLSISTAPGGTQVSYTGRGGANGVCTLQSSAAAPQSVPSTPVADDTVRLQCPGEGTVATVTTDRVTEYDKDKREFETHNELRNTDARVRGTVELELAPVADGYQGRIRLPRDLVPPIHSGDSGGWWSLEDVRTDGDVVHAKFRLNRFNRPTLRLDRRTGDLSLDGLSRFNGTCNRANAKRLF